mgnify:CR=1 FL=1
MKKILTMLLLIIVAYTSKAQTDIDTARIIDIAMASDYIFEGRVVEVCTFEDANGNVYTNNIIDISRFVKGQLNCGTVSLITRGGIFQDRDVRPSHTTRFTENFTGIFFCNDNTSYPIPNSVCQIPTSNPMSIRTNLSDFSYIGYYTDFINEVAEGRNSQFGTLQELYDFISNNTPFQLIECNPNIIANVNKFESDKKYKSIPLSNNVKAKKKTRTDYLDYQFVNPIVTGTNTKYFEFDVQVNSNISGTYLHESAFRLKYNPQAFGINIASAMQVSLATGFPATTYNYIQKIDKSDSVVSIWTHPAVNGQPKTLISSTFFQDFLHIKIPFTDCGMFPNIYTDTFANILDYSEYTIDPLYTQAQAVPYDYVWLDDTLIGTLCYPKITDVKSQATATHYTSAGTNDIITIKGENFGLNTSNASVFLKNVDDGLATSFPIQKYDVVSWSDTMVKFNLHSRFDSVVVIPFTSYNTMSPGSGNLAFVNSWSLKDSNSSNNFLGINYALSEIPHSFYNTTTFSTDYFKENQYLFGVSSDSSYIFRINSNITNDSMKWCIKAAFNHWRCLTGVNFIVSGNPTSDVIDDNDQFNTIAFDNSLPINTIAEAIPKPYNTCFDTHPKFGTSDIDIAINPYWYSEYFYDTTGTQTKPQNKRDFYRTIKHEIGHALMQLHVADDHDLMYFSDLSYSDSVIATNRNVEFKLFNNIAGDSIVWSSVHQSQYDYGCLPLYPMAMQDTCPVKIVTVIQNISKSELNFSAYPNPTNGIIYFESTLEGEKTIRILDISGKVINVINTKNSKIDYNTSQLQRGIYFAELIINNQHKIIKFICE